MFFFGVSKKYCNLTVLVKILSIFFTKLIKKFCPKKNNFQIEKCF